MGVALSAYGQGATNSPPPPPVHRQGSPGYAQTEDPINRLGQELKLSDDQKSKVRGVFQDTRERIQTAVQQAMTNADTELHRILTPEQYQKLQAMEHRPRTTPDGESTDGNSTEPEKPK